MLRDDIKATILDRMFDLSQGIIDNADLPDILADEISLLIEKHGKRLIIIQDGNEITYTPQDENSDSRLKAMLKAANVGFVEADDAIIIGKNV